MASNLHPEKRVNKNGVAVTKHVKSAAPQGTSNSSLPKPTTYRSPVSETKALSKEIRNLLQEQHRSLVPWSRNDWQHFKLLVDQLDTEALTAIRDMKLSQHLEPDRITYSPGVIGIAARDLRWMGVENPSAHINRDTLDARELLIRAIDAHGSKNGVPFQSEREECKAVYMMAFTDTDKVESIAGLIRERGPMPPEEIRAVLEEMHSTASAVREGTL